VPSFLPPVPAKQLKGNSGAGKGKKQPLATLLTSGSEATSASLRQEAGPKTHS